MTTNPNIQFFWKDFTSVPANEMYKASIIVSPVSSIMVDGDGYLVDASPVVKSDWDSSGSVTFPNLVASQSYSASFISRYHASKFNFAVPSGSVGTINGKTLLV